MKLWITPPNPTTYVWCTDTAVCAPFPGPGGGTFIGPWGSFRVKSNPDEQSHTKRLDSREDWLQWVPEPMFWRKWIASLTF